MPIPLKFDKLQWLTVGPAAAAVILHNCSNSEASFFLTLEQHACSLHLPAALLLLGPAHSSACQQLQLWHLGIARRTLIGVLLGSLDQGHDTGCSRCWCGVLPRQDNFS